MAYLWQIKVSLRIDSLAGGYTQYSRQDVCLEGSGLAVMGFHRCRFEFGPVASQEFRCLTSSTLEMATSTHAKASLGICTP